MSQSCDGFNTFILDRIFIIFEQLMINSVERGLKTQTNKVLEVTSEIVLLFIHFLGAFHENDIF